MKKSITLAVFLTCAVIARGQWSTAPAPNPISCNGQLVGIGTNSPNDLLHILNNSGTDDGITIEQSGSGASALYLKATGAGRTNWSMKSGRAGLADYYFIKNETSNVDAMSISGPGNIAMGPGAIGQSAQLSVAQTANTAMAIVANGKGGSDTSGFAYGVRANAELAKINCGGRFSSYGAATGVVNYGVVGDILNNVQLGSINYAVYGDVSGNQNLGAGPNYAGYFNGDVVTAGGFYFYSDKKIKKDIIKIENSLSIINKLNPVNYTFDTQGNAGVVLPTSKQYGFISQEVYEILPEFTKKLVHPAKFDDKGHEIIPAKEILGLNYQGFIALLTKGIQEQQNQINAQNKKISELEKRLNAKDDEKKTSLAGTAELNNSLAGFSLDQNIPNPFSSETVISYSLPQQIKNASLLIYDLSGKQIAAFPLEKTNNTITITSEKLAAGIYIYSVMADGKITDSKRMVVAEKQ